MRLNKIRESPHQGQPIVRKGVPLNEASAAMVLLHGRGASAEDILGLADEFGIRGFAYLAPQASDSEWYPFRFLEPVSRNQPWLSSALEVIGHVLGEISGAGIPMEQTMIVGFSQGACLALEFAARHPRRYGGVVGLSGGLIGAVPGPYGEGSLLGTPVFLGCSDVDPHIPSERVDLSARLLQLQGGQVTEILFPEMNHTINEEELAVVRSIMIDLLRTGN
ncbi:MAG: phospholipase [Bacteroidota bacterium]